MGDMFHRKHRREPISGGFTLIELLVVFTLLALLLTIAVPRYLETAEAARLKVRAQNMATIRDALDKYRADQGRYPEKLTDLVDKRYLRSIPPDPVTDTTDWVMVEDGAKREAGVFDIAAPAAETATVVPAADSPVDSPASANTPGAMPIPNGGQPVGDNPMPTPMNRGGSS